MSDLHTFLGIPESADKDTIRWAIGQKKEDLRRFIGKIEALTEQKFAVEGQFQYGGGPTGSSRADAVFEYNLHVQDKLDEIENALGYAVPKARALKEQIEKCMKLLQ